MGRTFETSKTYGGDSVPEVQRLRYATGQTFKKGAPLVDDAAGEAVECGADPAAILAISLQGAGTGPGFNLANDNEVVVRTGALQEVSAAIVNRQQKFHGRAVNGGTDPVVPLQTHIGEQYGITKVGTEWVIDFAKTGAAARVEITDVFPEINAFEFKFLDANMARP